MYAKKLNSDIGIVSFMAYPEIVSDENAIIGRISKIASDDFFLLLKFAILKIAKSEKKLKIFLKYLI